MNVQKHLYHDHGFVEYLKWCFRVTLQRDSYHLTFLAPSSENSCCRDEVRMALSESTLMSMRIWIDLLLRQIGSKIPLKVPSTDLVRPPFTILKVPAKKSAKWCRCEQ